MLRKLMKYEFKSTCRVYGIVYAAMVGLCLLSGGLGRLGDMAGSEGLNVFAALLMVLAVGFVMASMVISLVLGIRRFYQGIFQREGYLANTLPVKPWQLIASKLAPAVVWTAATALVALVALGCLVLALFVTYDGTAELLAFWQSLGQAMSDLLDLDIARVGYTLLLTLETCLLGLIAMGSFFLKAYASVALGQLLPRHRLAWAVGAWFAISVAENLLVSACAVLGAGVGLLGENVSFLPLLTNDTYNVPTAVSLLLSCLWYVAWGALYWAMTQWVLSHRLNLE